MEPNTDRFRAYLLGRLPAEEAERLEIDLLNEEELSAGLGSAEDDLIDDYTSNRLSHADRAAFLSRYKGPEARERVYFSDALRAKSAQSNIVPFHRDRTMFRLTIAAALGLVAVALAYVSSRPSLPHHPPQSAIAPQVKPLPVDAPTLVAFTVVVGAATRSQGEIKSLDVPLSAATVELRVPIDPAETYEQYTLELRDARGTAIWKQSAIEPIPAAEGRVAVTRVPASILQTGTYELALTAGSEDIGFESLRIRRVP